MNEREKINERTERGNSRHLNELDYAIVDTMRVFGEVIMFNLVAVIATSLSALIWMKIGELMPDGIMRDIFCTYVPLFYVIAAAVLCLFFNMKTILQQVLKQTSWKRKEVKKSNKVMIYDLNAK